jgi:hypothetical protein
LDPISPGTPSRRARRPAEALRRQAGQHPSRSNALDRRDHRDLAARSRRRGEASPRSHVVLARAHGL